MDSFYENKYVQVGLPLLMGIAAASSPAGARGAGALLTAMQGVQNVSEGRERREGERARTEVSRLRLQQEERLAKQPKVEYRDGQWYSVSPEGQITPVGVSSPGRMELEEVLSGKAPLPGQRAGTQPTGLPGQLPPDVERMVSEAERNVQAQIPGAQVTREGPSTPTSVAPGTRSARLRELAATPEGQAMMVMSGDPAMVKYLELIGKDDREIRQALAKQQALRPGEVAQRVETEKALQPLMVERQRQQGAAGVGLSVARQGALRTEEEQARRGMSAREAEDANLIKDINRYRDVQTGNPLKPSDPYLSYRQRETEGTAKKLSDIEEKEELALKRTVPILRAITQDIQKVYGSKGIFERLTPEQRLWAVGEGLIGRVLETNPDLAVAVKNIEGAKARIARIQGETGALAVRDVMTALEALPSLKGIPNSQAVAYGAMNNLIATANAGFGVLYGNDTFQHRLLPPLILPGQQAPAPMTPVPGQQPKVREDLLQQFQRTP